MQRQAVAVNNQHRGHSAGKRRLTCSWCSKNEPCRHREPAVRRTGQIIKDLAIELFRLFSFHKLNDRVCAVHNVGPRWGTGNERPFGAHLLLTEMVRVDHQEWTSDDTVTLKVVDQD